MLLLVQSMFCLFISKLKKSIDGLFVTLSRINLWYIALIENIFSFFEVSFWKLLNISMKLGEYNKTKIRNSLVYSVDSNIVCTMYPKFSCERRIQILPCHYFTSEPKNRGCKIL